MTQIITKLCFYNKRCIWAYTLQNDAQVRETSLRILNSRPNGPLVQLYRPNGPQFSKP